MKVRVQFFSHLRDAVGMSESEMELPEHARVPDLLGKLYTRHPRLAAWDKSILIGVGLEFVGRDHVLRPNEQIDLMPPVQGG